MHDDDNDGGGDEQRVPFPSPPPDDPALHDGGEDLDEALLEGYLPL